MFIKLTQLKQDQNTIETYLRDFEQLTLQCEINEKPEQKIARFVEGLDYKIASRVRLHQTLSFEEAVNLAMRVEKLNHVKPTPTKFPSKTVQYTPPSNPKPHEITPQNRPSTFDKAKAPMTTTQNTTALKKCFQCQGFGHFARECPNKRALSSFDVIHWGEDEVIVCDDGEGGTGEGGTGESEETELVEPDSGLSLVTWRVMHTQPQPLEEDQRLQLFRSRCTIGGRVCELIIDSGSCTNVASNTLIEKLSLPTQIHPSPYKLRWLNKGAEVKVSKQCLVSFSIGKNYSDKVLCDVLPMDACHLLLGRPWEFDRDSVRHGKDNTYSFEFGERKIKLTPLPPTLEHNTPPTILEPSKGIMLINRAEMVQEMSRVEDGHVLLPKNVSKGLGVPFSNEVQEFIKSYGGVWSFDPSITPSMFMSMVNEELRPYLGRIVMINSDDLSVSTPPEEEYLEPLIVLLEMLKEHKPYDKFKECSSVQGEVQSLGFNFSQPGTLAGQERAEALLLGAALRNITKIRGIHGIIFIHMRAIKNSNNIMVPLTKYEKGSEFKWVDKGKNSFGLLKEMPYNASILGLLSSHESFGAKSGANMGIGAASLQEFKSIVCFGEKWNKAKDRVVQVLYIHDHVDQGIERGNVGSKTSLEAEGLEWLTLRKERYPERRRNDLMIRIDNPFEALGKFKSEAYKEKPSGGHWIHGTLHLGDSGPCDEEIEDDDVKDLRTNPFQEGEIETKIATLYNMNPSVSCGFGPPSKLRSKPAQNP